MSKDETKARYGRIEGLVDTSTLSVRRFTSIAVGSMGLPVADQMVRHGVGTRSPGRIRLVDGDTVSERNLIGTMYRPCHIGMPKPEAAAALLQEINDEVNVTHWHRMLTQEDIPDVVNMAQQSDLLGLFADSFELMLEISDQCHDICPQVMAVFGPQADYAEVAFSVPKLTARLSQTMGQRKRQIITEPKALGCDTAYIANFVAALCIRLLLGEAKGSELMPCYANAPLFLIGLRRSWIFEKLPDDQPRAVFCVGTSSNCKPS